MRALALGDAWPASFYAALVTDTPTPNTKTFSELIEIATGNGYTGPIQITRDATGFPSVVESDADNLAYGQIKDMAIQAAGGPIPSSGQPIAYVVFIDDDVTPGDREVWAYSSLTQGALSVGETLTIDDWRLMLLEGILLVTGIENIQNVGTGGVGLFKQLVGKVAQLKNINSASARLTVTDDPANNEVDLDVVINDAGVSAGDLWSADKILSEIAAKRMWIPSVTDDDVLGTYAGEFLNTVGANTRVTGIIPPDVTSIDAAELWLVPSSSTGNGQYDVALLFAAIDEQYNAGSASATNQTLTVTANLDIHKVDVSSLFASVAAGDVFGLELTNDKVNNCDITFLGMYLEMS